MDCRLTPAGLPAAPAGVPHQGFGQAEGLSPGKAPEVCDNLLHEDQERQRRQRSLRPLTQGPGALPQAIAPASLGRRDNCRHHPTPWVVGLGGTRGRGSKPVINHSEKVNFIWSVKEILRDHYKRHQYGEVILPFCVLRRLDCVLEPTKEKVVAKAAMQAGDLDAQADLLAHVAKQSFYNTSKFTFPTLLGDQHNITENLLDYINGFSPNTRDALEKFGLVRHVEKIGEAGILYMVVQRFAGIDLHPELVPNLEMGYIYEELIRLPPTSPTRRPGSTSPQER